MLILYLSLLNQCSFDSQHCQHGQEREEVKKKSNVERKVMFNQHCIFCLYICF